MNIATKVITSFRAGGIRGLLLAVCNFVIRKLSKADTNTEKQIDKNKDEKHKLEIKRRYWFIENNTFGEKIEFKDLNPNTINWFVPNFENSSGGHLTVFRMIRDLEILGFKNTIIFEPPISPAQKKTIEEIRRAINENFLSIDVPIITDLNLVSPAYFSFATNWTTAYLLRDFISTKEKCYFIQDYEPYFYPPGTDYYLAERTYTFGFKTFTGGDWLAWQLKTKHQVDAHVFQFGCDTQFYTPASKNDKSDNGKRLLFYARPSTPRRGFELAMLAFEKLLNKVSDVEILLAGCDLNAFELPKGIKSLGVIPMPDLPKLYRSCDAALIISFTNVSLLPFDLMASGCAVISNSGPQTEWLLNEKIAMLSEADPESLFLALEKILTYDQLRSEMVKRAYDFVADRNWYMEAKTIAEILHNIQIQESCQARQMSVLS